MSARRPPFGLDRLKDPPAIRIVRSLVIMIAVPFFLVDGFAFYRRWIQVRRLELRASSTALRPGSSVIVDASSWATTWMTVRLELVQGARAETLLVHRMPPNREATLDPRPRNERLEIVLSDDQLARYRAGGAVLRASATGRSQILHMPAVVVRELEVTITPTPRPSSPASERGRYVAARPRAVDEPPRAAAGILVAKQRRESARPHVVVRVERGEPA
jgi:hypothetical protein